MKPRSTALALSKERKPSTFCKASGNPATTIVKMAATLSDSCWRSGSALPRSRDISRSVPGCRLRQCIWDNLGHFCLLLFLFLFLWVPRCAPPLTAPDGGTEPEAAGVDTGTKASASLLASGWEIKGALVWGLLSELAVGQNWGVGIGILGGFLPVFRCSHVPFSLPHKRLGPAVLLLPCFNSFAPLLLPSALTPLKA